MPRLVRVAIACNLVATVGIVAFACYAGGPFSGEYFPPDESPRVTPSVPVVDARRQSILAENGGSEPYAYGNSDPALRPWTILPDRTVRMIDEGR